MKRTMLENVILQGKGSSTHMPRVALRGVEFGTSGASIHMCATCL